MLESTTIESRDQRFLVGTCSWSDRSLVREGSFYPRPSMRASDRLAFYASRFPLAEVSTTRWFPPTPEQAGQWGQRTPADFTFDVQAWSLFTGAASLPSSLWPDLMEEVKPEARDKDRLYRDHLSVDALAECWVRFRHGLLPLRQRGRLGHVTLRLPHWLKPGRTATALLAEARAALDGWPVAVELASHRWHEGDQAEETIALLEDLDLALVCVDVAPHPTHAPPLLAATAGTAVLRALGRRPGRWSWPHRYTDAEIDEVALAARKLADGCERVHVLFANCHSDDAVLAAQEAKDRLVPELAPLTLF